jgi:hypothetical protein
MNQKYMSYNIFIKEDSPTVKTVGEEKDLGKIIIVTFLSQISYK